MTLETSSFTNWRFALLVSLLLISIAVVPASAAKTWTVGSSGCDFTTIDDALTNPALSDGDTVYFFSGTYINSAAISVSQSITLTGEGSSVVSIAINGDVTFSNTVTFSDIRFKDSTSPNFYLKGENSIIKNCVFENCNRLQIEGSGTRFENNIVIGTTLRSANGSGMFYLNNSFSNLAASSQNLGLVINADNNVVDGNSFTDFGRYGLSFNKAGTNNVFSRNNFISGPSVRLMSTTTSVNHIYLNNFLTSESILSNGLPRVWIWNTPSPLSYSYYGASHSGYLGNYWGSLYTGTDDNNDGVGDTSYSFVVKETQTDTYPLMDPFEEYFKPVADFSAEPLSGPAPLTVQFTDASTSTEALTYAWDFNNDGTVDSSDKDPQFTYNDPGTYTVSLMVTSSAGSDTETKDAYITVEKSTAAPEFPVAAFPVMVVVALAGIVFVSRRR